MKFRTNRIVGLIISVISVLLCVFAIELGLRYFAPVSDPFIRTKSWWQQRNQYIKSQFPPNYKMVTQAEKGLSGVEGLNNFTINNAGFRGDYLNNPKTKNEFRIFMVGGSTTECMMLDDTDTITNVVQEELIKLSPKDVSIKVYNAGKSGDASTDHISMIVHRIVHLDPDMIIIFSGLNDLQRSLSNYDYLHYANKVGFSKNLLWRLVATEFQIPRRIFYLLTKLHPTEIQILKEISLKSNYREKIEYCKSLPISNLKPRTNVGAYANNLKTIIGVAKVHRIRLLFITQQTTWNSPIDPEAKNWHWLRSRNGVTYQENLMDDALEALNMAMCKLAENYSIPVFDLRKTIPKSLEFLYDDAHFTVKGARIAGEGLAALILEKNLLL